MVAFLLSFRGSDMPIGGPSPNPFGEFPGPHTQDTHAAVGRQVTFGPPSARTFDNIKTLATLVGLANEGRVELVAQGLKGGEQRSYLYVGEGVFQSDRGGETQSLGQLLFRARPGGEITFTAVKAGTGQRSALDRDRDGFFNRDELDACSDPADGASTPDNSSCQGLRPGTEAPFALKRASADR
jgi:hypothetical protein